MFFTAMKNILSKGNVVHIQNEEEIDVMLHQHAFVIIDTLMNNVFHSNLLKLTKTNSSNPGVV